MWVISIFMSQNGLLEAQNVNKFRCPAKKRGAFHCKGGSARKTRSTFFEFSPYHTFLLHLIRSTVYFEHPPTALTTCVNAACKSCARSAPAKSECARRARPPNLTVRGARRHILVLITLLLAKPSHSFVRETALGGLHRLYRLGAAPRRRRSAACPLRGPPRQYVWARHVLQPGSPELE